jgi:hypothetical protein
MSQLPLLTRLLNRWCILLAFCRAWTGRLAELPGIWQLPMAPVNLRKADGKSSYDAGTRDQTISKKAKASSLATTDQKCFIYTASCCLRDTMRLTSGLLSPYHQRAEC